MSPFAMQAYDPDRRFNCYHCLGYTRTCTAVRPPVVAAVGTVDSDRTSTMAELSAQLLRAGDVISSRLTQGWATIMLVTRLVAWQIRADWEQ